METLEPLSFTLSLRGSYIFIIYCLSLQAYPKVSMQRLIFWVIPQSKTNFFWYFWCGGQLLVTISPPKTSHVIQPLHTLYSCKFEFTIKFLPYLAWFELRGNFLYALFSKLNKYALLSPLDNFNTIHSIATILILKRGVLVMCYVGHNEFSNFVKWNISVSNIIWNIHIYRFLSLDGSMMFNWNNFLSTLSYSHKSVLVQRIKK